jgi:putative addiction module component (TIGR02574 family)
MPFLRVAELFDIFTQTSMETVPMNVSIKALGIDRLSIEERLALLEDLWDSVAADSAALPLTESQRIELQKRIEEDDAHPDDIVPWEQVKASTLARLAK